MNESKKARADSFDNLGYGHFWDLKFVFFILFAEKEGSKAVHVTYKDRVKLVALTKQAAFGKYKPDASPDVGFLDVVGNDRR